MGILAMPQASPSELVEVLAFMLTPQRKQSAHGVIRRWLTVIEMVLETDQYECYGKSFIRVITPAYPEELSSGRSSILMGRGGNEA